MHDLEEILTKFHKIVSPIFCNKLAKECQFVKRSTSQLQGHEFVQAMVIPNGFIEAETLNSLAVRMRKINNDCDISASALAQRMNTKVAQEFMKACFGKVLKEIVKKGLERVTDLQNLSMFKRILIEDSTRAELDERLSSIFPGSGGVASKSSLKIDYIFDYHTEGFVSLDFCPGNKPDQSLASNIIHLLKKGDLVIRDLGYFALNRLKEIEEKEAFYISRWKVNQDVYQSKEALKPLNLAKFLDKNMCKSIVDVTVFVGKERRPVRLVASLLDENAINKRRRESNRSASRHGTTVSKKKTNLLKYSIFITNVPVEVLSSDAVTAIYRARWRVELIFKQWKSCLKLHIFKGYNEERFYCFLYGRLIMILLLGSINAILMQYALELGRELSSYKLANYLIADHALPEVFRKTDFEGFLNELIVDIPKRLCMDKRQRMSLRSNVRSNTSYYKELEINDLQNEAA